VTLQTYFARARAGQHVEPLMAWARLFPVAVVACLLTLGCNRSVDDPSQEPSPIEALATRGVPSDRVAEARLRGEKVFRHYCAVCHGNEGRGDGFNSTNLALSPQDFSSPEFWQQMTDAHLFLTVSKGGPANGKSVLMPAWGRTLTDRQLHDVVAFLHTFAPRAEVPTDKSDPPLEPRQ